MIDGKSNQPQVDHAPNGKYITSGDKINLEAVGDLTSLQPIERDDIRQTVNDDGQQYREDIYNLAENVFIQCVFSLLIDWCEPVMVSGDASADDVIEKLI